MEKANLTVATKCCSFQVGYGLRLFLVSGSFILMTITILHTRIYGHVVSSVLVMNFEKGFI